MTTEEMERVHEEVHKFVQEKPPPTFGVGPFHWSGETPEYVSGAVMERDTLRLIGELPSDIDAVVGVARSGLSVATKVSMYLNRPMYTLRQTSTSMTGISLSRLPRKRPPGPPSEL